MNLNSITSYRYKHTARGIVDDINDNINGRVANKKFT